MKSYRLDKELVVGTTYYTESDKALVIMEAGTDDTSKITLKVNGVPCLEITQDAAPLVKTSSNMNDLLKLGDLYVVVPPDTTFYVDGTASKKMRIRGFILDLAGGESLPAGYLARFKEQGKKFFSYISKNLTYDTTVPAGGEVVCYEFTCPTGEKWRFDNLMMAEVLDDTTLKEQFNVRLYLQDTPFDNLVSSKLVLGMETKAFPYPPNTTDGIEPGSLKDTPIDVLPGETLKITFINTGSSFTKSGTHAYYKVLLVGKKEYLAK